MPAGLAAKAAAYLQLAGDASVRVVAFEEAIAFFSRALALLANLPESPERDRLELPLQVSLGTALTFTAGPTAPKTVRAHERALALGKQLREPSLCWPPLYGLWVANFIGQGTHRRGRELGEELLSLAQGLPNSEPRLVAHRLLGTTLFYLGEARAAADHLEQAVALYDRQRHRDLVFRYSHDPGVMSLAYLALSLWWLGYPDQALSRSRAALDLADEQIHPFSRAFALLLAALLHHLRGEPKQVRELAQALLAQSTAYRLPAFLPQAQMLEGWALLRLGKVEIGQSRLRQGAADFMTAGNTIRLTYYPMLAEGHLALGQTRKGLATLSEALAIVDKTGERWCEAELVWLQGELLSRAEASRAEAESCFRKAIDLAAAQNAKPLELRATTSLARLVRGTDQREAVLRRLSAIYGWFTEGLQSPDILAAGALLNDAPEENDRSSSGARAPGGPADLQPPFTTSP